MVKASRMPDFSVMGTIESELFQEVQRRLRYKNGNISDISEIEQLKMETLDLLESLGYPMDEFGTYLYKDVITTIREQLGIVETREDVRITTSILDEAKSAFSQLYFNLARNERDIGVKEYHRILSKSLSKVDYKKASPELLYMVYGNFPFEMDYGENAFALANFLNRQVDKPLCRKFTNSPSK